MSSIKHNLALLPKHEQQKIQDDIKLWNKAHKLIKNHDRIYILHYLDGLNDDDRKDMARRLNTVKQNLHK